MSAPAVKVFFYGSYINFKVLAEARVSARDYQIARLPGFRLTIAPLANLVVVPGEETYGIVTELTHAELERLYVEHARGRLGGNYQPQAVLVEVAGAGRLPALCYLSHDMTTAPANAAYVDRILIPATDYGFPASYLDHIRSFK